MPSTSLCAARPIDGREDHLMPVDNRPPVLMRLRAALRGHSWSAIQRASLISVLAIGMAALFVTTYTLALGNPVPHGIPIAVVGDPDAHQTIVQAVAQVAGGPNFRQYGTLPAA